MKIEELSKIIEEAKCDGTYIIASIEGVGVHIGRIKNVTMDANNYPVIQVDIDAKSCTSECYFDKEDNHEN